jgi:hypothetical protein
VPGQNWWLFSLVSHDTWIICEASSVEYAEKDNDEALSTMAKQLGDIIEVR